MQKMLDDEDDLELDTVSFSDLNATGDTSMLNISS